MKLKVKDVFCMIDTGKLNLYRVVYENGAGRHKSWYMVSRKDLDEVKAELFNKKENKADAVTVCTIHEETGCLVLLKEFRVPINDYIYAFPAGLIEDGEDIYDAAKREFKEETGLDINYIDKTRGGKPSYTSVGLSDEQVAIVFGTCTGTISTKDQSDNEDAEIILIDKVKAENILKEGKLSARVELMLEFFIRYGRDAVL